MWCSAVGFIVTLILSMLAAPLAADAQPAGKIPRIGVLRAGVPPGEPGRGADRFRHGLRDLGYVEGQTIALEVRWAENQPERWPDLATDLVRLPVDIIVAGDTAAALAAKHATTTIPIVMAVSFDPVRDGLVASLARPGGNITGLSIMVPELAGKRLQLLKEAVPTIARVAILVNPTLPVHERVPGNIEREARALGVQLQRVEAGGPDTFEAAFAAMGQGGADALLIMEGAIFARNRQRLLDLARLHRLPTMSGGRHFAEAGSLVSYGADVRELCQRSAVLVDKILKGAKPSDLPVERADKFYLVVNLKTAQALGLTLSPTFLVQADEVIR